MTSLLQEVSDIRNYISKITLGWLQRYLQTSPMYWKTVTSYFLQSFQNWEAENFFFNTQVAPVTYKAAKSIYWLEKMCWPMYNCIISADTCDKDVRWTFPLLTGLSDRMNQMMHCWSEAVFTLCILQISPSVWFDNVMKVGCSSGTAALIPWPIFFSLSVHPAHLPALNPSIQTLVHTSALRTRTELLLPHYDRSLGQKVHILCSHIKLLHDWILIKWALHWACEATKMNALQTWDNLRPCFSAPLWHMVVHPKNNLHLQTREK